MALQRNEGLFTTGDWKILADALVEKTRSGQLLWELDPDCNEDQELSYLTELNADMCIYVFRRKADTFHYEIGAQQLKQGLWGVLTSKMLSPSDGIDLGELFDLVERKHTEPDEQLQCLLKEEFLVDIMGALDCSAGDRSPVKES